MSAARFAQAATTRLRGVPESGIEEARSGALLLLLPQLMLLLPQLMLLLLQ